MSNMREQLLAKTAGIRKTSAIAEDEVRRTERTQTAPGMAGALAVAQLRIQELEAAGVASLLPVADIMPNPWQPRRVFNDSRLSELAESVREVGLVQPIVVRRVESGYQIVAGERRWRVHKMLDLPMIKGVVVECSDSDMAVLALVENVSRDDLSDYEISLSIKRTEKEFPDRKRLAEALGLSRSGLFQFLSFAKLPSFILHDLDIQPRLLGANAADSIASTIRKFGDGGLAAAKEVWPEVVSGDLPQGKAAAAIKALATRGVTPSGSHERSIDKFFAGKEHAGSITKDANGFAIKFKPGVMTEELEAQIRSLISQTFPHRPK